MGKLKLCPTRCRLLKVPVDQYGLQTAFSEIERLHHEVTDGGNPIGLDLKTRYVVKGIKKEQIISSKVLVYYDKATSNITKVEDRWDGNLPDSSITSVSLKRLFSPWWWLRYAEGWVWYMWSFTWDMWWWQVRVILCMPTSHRFDNLEINLVELVIILVSLTYSPFCVRFSANLMLSQYQKLSVFPRTTKRMQKGEISSKRAILLLKSWKSFSTVLT